MSTILTTNELYNDPVLYKLIIKSPDELEDIYAYDPFASNNPFALTGITVELSSSTFGGFSFDIDDTVDKVIKDTVDCGNVVVIQAGKHEDELRNVAFGIIDEVNDDYPIGNQIKYNFKGSGKGIISNYTIVNFIRSANKEDIVGPQSILNDPKFRIDNLMKDLFESKDILPELNSLSLKDRGGFNTDQITGSTNVVTPTVDQSYSTASNVADNFAAASGTVLYIDPDLNVQMRTPYRKHSGITIRPWTYDPITKLPDRTKDNAATTSYYDGGWSSSRQMKAGEFFNKVFLTINTDEIVNTAPGDESVVYTSTAGKDIGVQFIPGSTKLFNIALLLSKVGTGRSSVDDAYNLTGVQGLICRDDGNNSPSGKIVATFTIPYDSIPTSPTPIYKISLQYKVAHIDANALHWLILFKSGDSEDNTIRWYHDNDITTPSTATVPRFSATKKPFTRQPNPSSTDFDDAWSTSSTGPVYRYTFFATARTTLAVSDPISIRKYTPDRPVEVRINAPWINDVKTGIRYANTLLAYGAKLKRIFEKKKVSIPTGLFFPLQLVNIVYPLAGLDQNSNLIAEIDSVRYQASAYDESNPFGSYDCEVTATAYVNHFQNAMRRSLGCGQ